jgi:hypothetical protein
MPAAKRAPAPKKAEEIIEKAPEHPAPELAEILDEQESTLEAEFDAQAKAEARIAELEAQLAATQKVADTAFKPPSRRATLMYAPRGNSRLYVDGQVRCSWDKNEPEKHIWQQIEKHTRETRETEVDVVYWENRILPDQLPPEEKLGVRAQPKIADQVPHEPSKTGWSGAGEATTSYHTSGMPVQSLG